MAISITATIIPSIDANSDRPLSYSSFSKLSASTSLRFPRQLRHSQTRIPSIFSSPQRRIFPRVEAKKQSFSSFDELLANTDKPVLVDFYATWCGPCQFMGPVLDEVSAALTDKIQVVKIDTEKYPKIANQYNIEALPTFIIFKDGKPCDRFEGALPAPKLIKRIESTLKVKQ